ncbi:UNKNOWN [Stylonychia lemnae]|uniref:CRAL-TRIO domain-containing protein n=1 Tax=Stylonychia lemnae TaxID=5949 RepID=A0A078B8E9_STYLE|nr:UNKNOWN [Stylonychia lemnae]|eukprot:CDW89833.1 UNKNOWN [Stylonychia lemnae]
MVESIQVNPFITSFQFEPRHSYLLEVTEEVKIPLDAYRFFPSSIISSNKNKIIEDDKVYIDGKYLLRRVFYGNQEFEAQEQEELQKFINLLKDNQVSLSKENLQAAKYDYKESLGKLMQWFEWRSSAFPLRITDKAEIIINSGLFYIHGRDRNFRPLIVVRPQMLTKLMAMRQLHTFLRSMQGQYRCVVVNIFLLNASRGFKMIWSTVKGFLETHTTNKIVLTDKKTHERLFEHFHPSQIEKRYGGESPNIDFFQWPPRMPRYVVDDVVRDKLVSEEKYEQILAGNPGYVRF